MVKEMNTECKRLQDCVPEVTSLQQKIQELKTEINCKNKLWEQVDSLYRKRDSQYTDAIQKGERDQRDHEKKVKDLRSSLQDATRERDAVAKERERMVQSLASTMSRAQGPYPGAKSQIDYADQITQLSSERDCAVHQTESLQKHVKEVSEACKKEISHVQKQKKEVEDRLKKTTAMLRKVQESQRKEESRNVSQTPMQINSQSGGCCHPSKEVSALQQKVCVL